MHFASLTLDFARLAVHFARLIVNLTLLAVNLILLAEHFAKNSILHAWEQTLRFYLYSFPFERSDASGSALTVSVCQPISDAYIILTLCAS